VALGFSLHGVLRMLRPGAYLYWCPGCAAAHSFDVHGISRDGHVVGWDGDVHRPSVGQPLVFPGCEHELNAGRIRYEAGCRHALAGKTVDMVPFPEP
jgi:hypothetical protein